MLKQIIAAALLTAGIAAAAPALAQATVGQTAKGKTLVDAKGMTLYTFDHDMSGQSNCIAGCAKNWPALAAGAEAKASGDWTTIARDDGTKQWAYKGKPLYTFVKDEKPGDTNGDGMLNNAWHIATP
jgi:predicted lipoprotein with Yx(FWY)xxD motif